MRKLPERKFIVRAGISTGVFLWSPSRISLGTKLIYQ